MSRRARVFAACFLATGAFFVVVGCCGPQLIVKAMTPSTPFAAAAPPPAPDYQSDASWLALPTTNDEADVALPSLPATTSPRAAVFYLHSTSNVDGRWNAADVDDVRAASISGGTLIQASAYNACCAVYAPGYRQANGTAFTTPSPDGERAKDLAYGDVVRAYDEFVARKGALPFIVVGHSQGAVYAARLLDERVHGSADEDDLVAAYVVGAPVVESAFPACAAVDSVGCVVAYNARGPRHTPQPIDFGGTVDEAHRLCVNPALHRAGDDVVEAAAHGGAVFFDAAAPQVLPRFLRSQCKDGRLVVDELQPLPDRGLAPAILLRLMGGENFHPVEFQLFYVDLRNDAVTRVAAWHATHNPG